MIQMLMLFVKKVGNNEVCLNLKGSLLKEFLRDWEYATSKAANEGQASLEVMLVMRLQPKIKYELYFGNFMIFYINF